MLERRVARVKLHPPRLPAGRIARPRLIAKLDEGLHGDVILVAAPAGYGKTTLVCQWLQHQPLPSAWLSLDSEDGELHVFVAGLVAAIRTVHPGCCQGVMAVAGTPSVSLVDALAEELAEGIDGVGEFVLVVDDCDFIRDGASVELLARLVRRMPKALHLVLVGRREPTLPFGGLRGQGRFTEVRARDLRFTQKEATAFLAQATGEGYSEPQVAALVQRTEGWIAGLHLAALSLRGRDDPSSLIDDFAGSDRYVADYLMQEIFARLSPPIQEYLLSTSILERMCGPLCRAVIGPTAADTVDGLPMLDWLERANLFVVALDNERSWFRYHHLFRDLLVHSLRASRGPAEVAELHRRAGVWLGADGQVDMALDHLLAAGDVTGACAVVIDERPAAVSEERWFDLQRWTRRLPRQAVDREPELLVAEAWGQHPVQGWGVISRNLDLAEPLLRARAPSAQRDLLQSEMYALRAALYYWEGDGERCLVAARRATELSGDTRSQAWTLSQVFIAGGLQLVGDLDGARREYRQMMTGSAPGTFPARVLVGAAMVELMAGDLTAAANLADSMERLGAASGTREYASWAHMVRGFVSYQRGDVTRAETEFAAVVSRPFRSHAVPLMQCFFWLALAQWARGAVEEASVTAARAVELLGSVGEPKLVTQAQAFQLRLDLLSGRPVAIADWLSAFGGPPATDSLAVVFEYPPLVLAHALIAGGSTRALDRAASLLGMLRATAERTGNTFRRIQIGSLLALLHDRLGELEIALEALADAVELGRPGGFVRVYVDLGGPMHDMLERLQDGACDDDHLRRIIGAFPLSVAGKGPGVASGASSAPVVSRDLALLLTNREYDVLVLLDQRLSNKEIARRLVVSPATVKRHTLSIYRKLQVGGRREAAIRARELGLL